MTTTSPEVVRGVLAFVRAHNGERHPIPEMAKELGVSYVQAARALAALTMAGEVCKIRKGNGWAYSATENEAPKP